MILDIKKKIAIVIIIISLGLIGYFVYLNYFQETVNPEALPSSERCYNLKNSQLCKSKRYCHWFDTSGLCCFKNERVSGSMLKKPICCPRWWKCD